LFDDDQRFQDSLAQDIDFAGRHGTAYPGVDEEKKVSIELHA
jgi:hypothetical protein